MREVMFKRIVIVFAVLLVIANVTVWLLQHRPQPGQPDSSRDRELLAAATEGDAATVDRLLSLGADANASRDGNTALILCACWEQYDMVMFGREEATASIARSLLAHGADPNHRNDAGMTALMYAGGWAHLSTLTALLDGGADPNIRDDKGRTALTWAARNGPAYSAPLVDKGAKVGVTEALLMGYMTKARNLIQSGSDLSIPGGLDETPLMIAAEWGDLACVNALLARNVDVNARDSQSYTALMIAAAGRPKLGQMGRYWDDHHVTRGRAPIVQALISAGANLDAGVPSYKGRDTALSLAIEGKNQESIHALLAAGAKRDR
jgi:ankyrin repeat protein